jgi:hypothetical protein
MLGSEGVTTVFASELGLEYGGGEGLAVMLTIGGGCTKVLASMGISGWVVLSSRGVIMVSGQLLESEDEGG